MVPAGFPRISDVVSSCSPYVTKVEAWLRFVGLPYTKINGGPADSPKGQVISIRCLLPSSRSIWLRNCIVHGNSLVREREGVLS